MHATLEEQVTDRDLSLMNRYNVEALPRSIKLRPLAPEFSHYTYVVTPCTTWGSLHRSAQTFSQRNKDFVPQNLDVGSSSGGTIWW